jgi:hypothetical protein
MHSQPGVKIPWLEDDRSHSGVIGTGINFTSPNADMDALSGVWTHRKSHGLALTPHVGRTQPVR